MNNSESAENTNPFEQRIFGAIQKILPEAEAVRQQGEQSFPFAYEIHGQGKTIIGYAADHSCDPAHPMFKDLHEKFSDLNPDFVIVEGIAELEKELDSIKKSISGLSDEEVISRYGEPIFALKLADEKGIPVTSPEFSNREELDMFLSNGVSKEHIFAYYFYRGLNGYSRQTTDKQQLEARLRRGLERFKKFTKWDDFDFSYEHAERLSMNLWGVPLTYEPGFYNERVSHWSKETLGEQYSPVNDVGAILNKARDQNIIKATAHALGTHDRVMIVFGGSHMVQIRPALEHLLSNG